MLLNTTRAREWMERSNVDAIIATSPVNVMYFSGYYVWTDVLFRLYMMMPGAPTSIEPNHVLYPKSGSGVLICNRFLAVNAGDVDQIYAYGNRPTERDIDGLEVDHSAYPAHRPPDQECDSPMDGLAKAATAEGVSDGRIALDTEWLSEAQIDDIRKVLPKATLLRGDDLIRMIRMVKTAEEVARLEKGAEIAERASLAACGTARPGIDIQEVVQEYRTRIVQDGAEYDHFIFSMGGYGMGMDPNHKLQARDALFIDWGVLYRHYFSDTGTTLLMHEPRDIDRKLFGGIRSAMEAGINQLKPGNHVSAVCEAMTETMDKHGLGGQNPHGHGIGAEVRDYPILTCPSGLRIKDECVDLDSDLPMEVDMVLNLEVCSYHPGHGAYQTEQSFVITETGCRPLIEQQRDEPIVAG